MRATTRSKPNVAGGAGGEDVRVVAVRDSGEGGRSLDTGVAQRFTVESIALGALSLEAVGKPPEGARRLVDHRDGVAPALEAGR